MPRTTTLTVRVSGALSDFVAANTGDNGIYENVSEYIRDLIRRDRKRAEAETLNRLRAELTHAFDASDESYQSMSATDVIVRNQS